MTTSQTDDYRVFVCTASLVPTGALMEICLLGGHLWGQRYTGHALCSPIAAKLAETFAAFEDKTREFDLTDFNTKPESLQEAIRVEFATRLAHIHDTITFAYQALDLPTHFPDTTPTNTSSYQWESYWQNLSRKAQWSPAVMASFLDHTKHGLAKIISKRYSAIGLTETYVRQASTRNRGVFGYHEGWSVNAVALPRVGYEATDQMLAQLGNLRWTEISQSYMKFNAALNPQSFIIAEPAL